MVIDGYVLQDALVLEFPGGPCMNEQRKDDHGKPKGGEANILGTPTAQPQRHSKHPGHRKTNQTNYYYTYPINTTSQTDGPAPGFKIGTT